MMDKERYETIKRVWQRDRDEEGNVLAYFVLFVILFLIASPFLHLLWTPE